MRISLLLLSLVLTWLPVTAQLAVRNFSTEHGMPSDNVYCVFSDRDGFLWFGTDNGLARFDGQNFKVFTSADGLADNEIFGVFQGKDDRLWLRTYSGKACYISNGRVFSSANDSSLKGLDFSSYTFSVAEFNDTLFFTSSGGAVAKYHNGRSWQIPYPPNSMLIPTEKGLYSASTRLINKVHGGSVLSSFRIGGRAATRTIFLQDRFFLAADNHLLIFREGQDTIPVAIHMFESRLQFISRETDTTLLLGAEMGAYRYHIATDVVDTLLANFPVSYIQNDFEGGLWITTLGNGAFYFGNSKSVLLGLASPGKPHREFLFAQTPKEGRWFCAGENGDITYLDEGGTVEVKNADEDLPWGRIRCMIWLNEDSLFLSAERRGGLYEPKKGRFTTKTPWLIAKVVSQLPGDSAIASAGASYYPLPMRLFKRLVFGEPDPSFLALRTTLRVTSIVYHGNKIFAGSNNGVYLLMGPDTTKIDPKNPLLNDRVSTMAMGNNGNLWVGLANQGIVWVENGKAKLLDPGFKVVNVRQIRTDEQGNLWACNHEGVFKFSRSPSGKYVKESYTPAFGYPLANAWDILPMKDDAYVATDQGLIRFEPFSITSPPRLIVEEVQYGDEQIATGTGTPLQIDRPGKRLIVRFAGISFGNYGQLSYRYRIPQINDQWKTTTSTEIAFLDMRPGDYVLELKAVGNSGFESITNHLRFSIAPYFYQTAWFFACCVLVLVAIVVLIVRSRVRRVQMIHEREQEKSKKEIERIEAELYVRELEQKAMRLQMNPHFIFNALNTIQGLYANKDIPKAKEYISKLSTLIRQILEQSSYTTISLGMELELVRGYLNVTLYRFENLFQYEIDVQPGINLEAIAVPP